MVPRPRNWIAADFPYLPVYPAVAVQSNHCFLSSLAAPMHAEGLPPKELAEVLELAKSMMAVDANKDAPETKPEWR